MTRYAKVPTIHPLNIPINAKYGRYAIIYELLTIMQNTNTWMMLCTIAEVIDIDIKEILGYMNWTRIIATKSDTTPAVSE